MAFSLQSGSEPDRERENADPLIFIDVIAYLAERAIAKVLGADRVHSVRVASRPRGLTSRYGEIPGRALDLSKNLAYR
jgi:hypothetical protein